MLTILCVATYVKGDAFLRECRRLGCRVVLLTADSLAGAEWPRDAIDEIHTIPRTASDADVRGVVASIARRHAIDRVAALDDFDVELGAMIREFLQVPGFGRTVAARFRDKLTMRTEAKRLGIAVPEFTSVFTDDVVREWAGRVKPPWVLKPRSSAAATGIRRIDGHDDLWPALDAAGGERAMCLLEQFVSGDVYHVDSIVRHGRVAAAFASKYGRPPMQVAHQGGVFVTRRLPDASPEARALFDVNLRLLTGFGLDNGVSHTEFIGSSSSEFRPTFLETSARVGGAYIADVLEAATGINLWREWAKMEVAGADGDYASPAIDANGAGIALCLARQSEPDLSGYTDPEIALRIKKPHHAGLIVRSPDHERVDALLTEYATRFAEDFLATLPPRDRPVD